MKEKSYTVLLDKVGNDRIRVRLKIQNGVLVDVVYQYETWIDQI